MSDAKKTEPKSQWEKLLARPRLPGGAINVPLYHNDHIRLTKDSKGVDRRDRQDAVELLVDLELMQKQLTLGERLTIADQLEGLVGVLRADRPSCSREACGYAADFQISGENKVYACTNCLGFIMNDGQFAYAAVRPVRKAV